MSGSVLFFLQQAIYSLLTSDAELMSKVTGVFDAVSDDQTFPYVTIGEATSLPYRTFDKFGEECTITLHIWSRYKGFKEAAEILDDLNRILADAVFSVSGWGKANSYYDFSETLRDPDGITRHIPVRYRIIVQKEDE